MAKKPNLENPLYHIPTNKRNVGGLMLGSMLTGLGGILLFSWIATQYLASGLGYQGALGNPLFSIGSYPMYHPLKWIMWVWKWRELQDPVVKHHFGITYMIVVIGSFLAVICAAYLAYRRTRKLDSGIEHLHGSAHWATKEEIMQTTLLQEAGKGKGVYVGAWQDPKTLKIRYLRHDGPEHIMAFAPTRSGKGVGLILPTLLSWPQSAIVYDIKGENWALTAGWRQKQANNLCLKFEPTCTNGSGACYNPLEEIRIGTDKEVSDVQNIVNMIVDPDGKGLQDHWSKTGAALLVGTILHVLYSENDKTLTGVANFLSEPTRTLEETLHYMLNSEHDPDRKHGWTNGDGEIVATHPVVAASARDMLNKSENESSGVLSTSMSFLTLYRDPIVSANTRYSQFKIHDLMNGDKPVSLYLVVPPSDKDRLKPLIRLLINQIVRRQTESMEFKDGRSVASYKYRQLILLDEFPSLGKLDIFEEALAFIAGYGMKAYLIIQDISQLWTAYGKDESIFSNCHVRIAYAPNKIETARLLSDMTGQTTVVAEMNSFSGDRLNPMLSNVSTSQQATGRALLTPDEVMRLPAAKKDAPGNILEAGDMLIFVAGHAPIYGKQILYFQDPTFLARAKVDPPTTSDRLRDPPRPISLRTARPAPAAVAAPKITQVQKPVASPQPIPAASAATHMAENPAGMASLYPEAEETDTAAAASAPAELEEAPDDVGAPIELHIANDGSLAFESEDAPPLHALAMESAVPTASKPAETKKPAGSGFDLLKQAIEVSQNADQSDYAMFDDVLATAPADAPAAAASPTGGPGSDAQQQLVVVDGIDDLLAEIKREQSSSMSR